MSVAQASAGKPSERPVPISDLLDDIPMGPFHRRLLAICCSAWAFDGMEVILIGFTLPILIKAWSLSGSAAGLLGLASLMWA